MSRIQTWQMADKVSNCAEECWRTRMPLTVFLWRKRFVQHSTFFFGTLYFVIWQHHSEKNCNSTLMENSSLWEVWESLQMRIEKSRWFLQRGVFYLPLPPVFEIGTACGQAQVASRASLPYNMPMVTIVTASCSPSSKDPLDHWCIITYGPQHLELQSLVIIYGQQWSCYHPTNQPSL